MEKRKNKKLVVLASVLALSCACGATTAIVSNDAYSQPTVAYAELTTSFTNLVNNLKTKAEASSKADVTEDKDVAKAMWAAYFQKSQDDNAGITSGGSVAEVATMAEYNKYYVKFEGMIMAALEADNATKVITDGKLVYFSEKAAYEAKFDFTSFTSEQQNIIWNDGEYEGYFGTGSRQAKKTTVDTYFNAKGTLETTAKEYVENNLRAPHVIAIADETKIDTALDLIEDVYGDVSKLDAEKASLVTELWAEVKGYETQCDTLLAAVNALKGKIEKLEDQFPKGECSALLFYELEAEYDSLTAEQKGKIDTDTLPGTSVTYKKELANWKAEYEIAYTQAGPVIKLINDITPKDPITIESAPSIIAAENAYAAIDSKYQPYVSNRQVMFDARTELDAIIKDVNDWKKELDLVPEAANIKITDWETVYGKKDVDGDKDGVAAKKDGIVEYFKSKNFSNEMKAYITANETVAWAKYNAVQAAVDAIVDEIQDVADAFTNLPNIGDDPEPAEVSVYALAYENANALYTALTADEVKFFVNNHAAAEAARKVAADKYAVYGVEAKILAIPTADSLTLGTLVLADYENYLAGADKVIGTVKAAETAFNALDATRKPLVRASYKTKLDAALAAIKVITDELDAWKGEVKKAIEVDYLTIKPSVINTLKTKYNGFDAAEKAYVAETYNALIAKETEIMNNIAAINAEIKRISGLEVIVASDRTSIENIETTYNAMCDEQQALIEGYEEVIAATKARIEMAEYVETAIAGLSKTVLSTDGLVQTKIVRALYENLATEIKGLVGNEAYLKEVENAYAASGAVVLDIKALDAAIKEAKAQIASNNASVVASVAAINSLLADLATADAGLATALNNVAKDLADAITAYETADKALEVKVQELLAKLTAAEAEIDAIQAALNKEVSDRVNADKELEDKLMAEIKSLNTKLVVSSVILAVACAGLIAAAVLLFLKKQDK